MYSIKYIPASTSNYRAGRSHKIDQIIIHFTATEAPAYNNGVYFSRPNGETSAHYFLDGSGTIIQSVQDKDIAWHAVQANYRSIGIEVVSSGRDFTEAEILELQWLVTWKMKEYGISKSGVLRHFDVTGKQCPRPYVDNAKWQKLKDRITTQIDTQSKLIIYSYWRGHNQQWAFVKDKNGKTVIVNRKSGKAIDVANGDYTPGQQLIAYEQNDGANQDFTVKDVTPQEAVGLKISPVQADKLALAVSGASYKAGTPVILWDYKAGSAEQLFMPVIAVKVSGVTYYTLFSCGALKAGLPLCLDEAS